MPVSSSDKEIGANPDRDLGRISRGPAAVELARGRHLHAVILQSTFTSPAERVQEMASLIPVKPQLNFHYPNREKLASIGYPMFIIHSVDDYLIPFSRGKKLYWEVPEPKFLLRLTGSHGRVLRNADRYL